MGDEEINELLARSVCVPCMKKGIKSCGCEIELFNKLDEDRYREENKDE